ncbi:MAG: lycopene cyclase family protein, partial [Chitinophagaceae bacterium]
MQHKHFDFIIAGAGAAGLSLLVRMILSGKFADSKILLADKEPKKFNDRTWCFWEKENGLFEELIFKSWNRISIFNTGFSKHLDIAPYRYKMIRGIDFYQYCFDIINAQKDITVEYGEITAVRNDGEQACIEINGQILSGDYVFNSIRLKESVKANGTHNLLQHFTGWIVEMESEVFDEQTATLMDFRTSQEHGCSFVYVMPFTKNTALVEYTLFSKQLLRPEQYAESLTTYLSTHFPGVNYVVTSTEFGVIPMT